MTWLRLRKEDAERNYNAFCNSGSFSYDSSYSVLRGELTTLFYNVLEELGIDKAATSLKGREAYLLDLSFGLKLFELLNEKYELGVRDAADANFWRYLSVCVVPDLVAFRYGKDHKDRFWAKDKRIWLSTIWWYIFLSWQGSGHETYAVLYENTTDEILQLVDRCGRGGYRVELSRKMMKQYAAVDLKERRNKKLFRKLMVLNTAKVQVIEPDFLVGGTDAYIKMLYDYID